MHIIVKFIPEPDPAIMVNLGSDVSNDYIYSFMDITMYPSIHYENISQNCLLLAWWL
jgi:hypothetical protein